MFKNYLKSAIRNLLGDRTSSAINILGLTIGMTCGILIALFVRHELSYDDHHQFSDRIYRVTMEFKPNNGRPGRHSAKNAPLTAPTLVNDFPSIEEAGRILGGRALVAAGENKFYESNFMMADQSILRIFDFDFIKGDPSSALDNPDAIILTESIASKYFGSRDPLGQTVTVEDKIDLRVTGVIRDLPQTTHLNLGMLASLPAANLLFDQEEMLQNWKQINFYTYLLLKEGADIEELELAFPAFLDRHIEEQASSKMALNAQRVTDIHLNSNLEKELKENGNIFEVYAFTAIAVIILLVGCINFMNLSTARSTKRAKEVGMRKVLGATKRQLVFQFLGESIVFAGIALFLSIVLVELLLPWFNAFVGKELQFAYLQDWWLSFGLIVTAFLVAIIAGSYPAFYISAFEPAAVLSGTVTRGRSGSMFRKFLVVFQFTITIVLLVSTFVVFAQLKFAKDFDTGYEKENIVVLSGPVSKGFSDSFDPLRQELLNNSNIKSVTGSIQVPTTQITSTFNVIAQGSDPEENLSMRFLAMSYDFFDTYNIRLLAGRKFSREMGTDALEFPSEKYPNGQGAYILNENAVRQFGWSADTAIGKAFAIKTGGGRIDGEVIGVVEDFHFSSIRESLQPVMYLIAPDSMLRFVSIKINESATEDSLKHVRTAWDKVIPDQPLSQYFLEDKFDAQYQSETKQGQIFVLFSILSIIIGCLGLFGLASFSTQQRTKEIGIRKVLGASSTSITVLFTKELCLLVLLASLPAWPIAYYLLRSWLDNFAYRIDLSLVSFVLSTVIAVLIAALTVGSHAVRMANSKPVLALRCE